MQNILYIGPYKELNGIALSSRRYIDAILSNSNINLAIRPIFFTKPNTSIQVINQYTEFEENTFKSYDMVIQHGHADIFEYNSKFGKNIGITEIETKNIKHSGWIEKINLMDEIVVGSKFSHDSLSNAGVTIPIKIVPEPYDVSKYTNVYNKIFNYDGDKPFIFYTIGNYTEKKNIRGIILAFLLEFDYRDNVKLFVKTGDSSGDHDNLKALIEFDIVNIKKTIRKDIGKTPDIDIVCGYISDNDIIRLHQGGDCYVNAVRSDGFGPCAIESKLCDKLVINTKHIGSSDYLNSTNSIMIDGYTVPVFSSNFYNRNTFRINESWLEPDVGHLRQAMRHAFGATKSTLNQYNDAFNKNLFSQNQFLSNVL